MKPKNTSANILIVDDQKIIHYAVSKALKKNDYSSSSAFSGEEALQKINTSKFDLILMDIDLGEGIDGIETAQKILNIQELPIVFLTAHSEKKIISRMNEISRYGFIAKDSSDSILCSSIDMALKLFKANQTLKKQKQELEAGNKRLQLALVGSQQGLFDWDLLTNKMYISTKLNSILTGINSDDTLNIHKFTSFIHPADTDNVFPNISLFDPDSEDVFETRFRVKSEEGGWKWINSKGKALFDNEGKAIRFTGLMSDIDKEQFNLSKMHAFTSVIENSDNIIVFKDKDLKVIATNNAFAHAAGYNSAEELIGKTDAEIFKVSENTEPIQTYMKDEKRAQSLNKGESIIREEPVHYKDGSIHTVYTKKYPIFDKQNRLLGTANMSIDITDLKKKQTLLKESEQRFEIILQTLPCAVFVHDINGNIIQVNRKSCEYTGYTRNELLNMSVSDIDHSSNERNDSGKIWKTLHNGSNVKIQSLHFRKDGSHFPVEITITAVQIKDERVFIAIAEDISERKRQEAIQQENIAEKEMLLKDVHCRVRNNMNTVMSLLYLQADTIKNEFASDALKEAAGRIQSMQFLYEQLHHSGTFNHYFTKDYLGSLAELILYEYRFSDKIEIHENISNIKMHPNHLFHLGIILNEVITNAIKHAYTDIINPQLWINLERKGNNIVFSIEDNGIGFNEELIVYDKCNTGLLMIKILSESFKGDFKIESNEGFKYTLKFHPEQ